MAFSERLVELRSEKGLSQAELSNELGVSKNSIYYYENEKRVPDANTVIKFARFFNVTTDYLLGLEDVRTHDKSMLIEMLNDREARLYRYSEQLCRIYMEIGDVLNANTTQS
jgi:transcriptional regulator with XRE-family HTH domain